MATWEIGNTLQDGLYVYNSAGALADLGGGDPTCTVTLPSGSTTPATVSKTTTGTYVATLVAAAAGRHTFYWEGSGDNSGRLPRTTVLDVWPTDPRLIISLADARAALNIPASSTANDDEIRLYIAAATPLIEAKIGRVLSGTVVETFSGDGRPAVALHSVPTSITSVVEDGVTLTADTQYVFDEAGLLWRGSAKWGGQWSSTSPRNVTVTYVAGPTSLSPAVVRAAREAVRVQYQRSELATRPVFGDDGAPMSVPIGWGTVDELLDAAMAQPASGLTPRRFLGFA